MSISPIGFTPGFAALPTLPATPPVAAPSGDFGNLVTQSLDRLDALRSTSEDMSVQAATGDLQDVHDYMIAATESSVATELTVAVRNKAVEAFTEIMRMSV